MKDSRPPVSTPPFWKTKTLHEMNRKEWESLCDGCARCCLHKLQNKKTGKVYYTYVACRFLDVKTCRCTIYNDPYTTPSDCIKITPENVSRLKWLPDTCAYRRVAEKRNLEEWHPLVSGDPDSVHREGISIRDKTVSERQVHPEDLENFVIKE